MEITTELVDTTKHRDKLDRSSDALDPPAVAPPLQRLLAGQMSGEEIVTLLQKYWMMPQLQRELILDAELDRVECTAAEIFGAYKTFYQTYQLNSDADRDAWLQRNRCTLAQLEHTVIKSLKLDRFKHQKFASKIESYFLERKSQLDRASYYLLRVKDPHLAQELFFRVQDGEASFAELAKQYSEGAEAVNGGEIVQQEMSIPHPNLAKKIAALKPGELAPPIQIFDWFVVVQLQQYFPASLDDNMRSKLIDELYERWMQEQLNSLELFK